MNLSKFTTCLLLVVPGTCRAQAALAPPELKSSVIVTCSNGFTPGECRDHQAAVQRVLETLRPPLRDWRFVIVPDHAWREACRAFQLKRCGPAFSHPVLRATYLNSRVTLLFDAAELDEDLARFTPWLFSIDNSLEMPLSDTIWADGMPREAAPNQ